MKFSMTRKEISRKFSTVYSCGYCELEPLFSNSDAVGFNSGVYGWNFNVFSFGSVAITSGYRGMFGAELPEKCRRILKNAANYCRDCQSGRDWDRRWHTETYIPGEGFSVFFGEIARKSKKAEEHAAALLRENLRAYLERMAARAGLELVQPVKIAEIR